MVAAWLSAVATVGVLGIGWVVLVDVVVLPGQDADIGLYVLAMVTVPASAYVAARLARRRRPDPIALSATTLQRGVALGTFTVFAVLALLVAVIDPFALLIGIGHGAIWGLVAYGMAAAAERPRPGR